MTNKQPARDWVGLTNEDKAKFWIYDEMTTQEWEALFNAIEAKLKEKNAAPPARNPWVGLTDEERQEIYENNESWWEQSLRTEAKLKEKNGDSAPEKG
jgi:hypothetical protein